MNVETNTELLADALPVLETEDGTEEVFVQTSEDVADDVIAE